MRPHPMRLYSTAPLRRPVLYTDRITEDSMPGWRGADPHCAQLFEVA